MSDDDLDFRLDEATMSNQPTTSTDDVLSWIFQAHGLAPTTQPAVSQPTAAAVATAAQSATAPKSPRQPAPQKPSPKKSTSITQAPSPPLLPPPTDNQPFVQYILEQYFDENEEYATPLDTLCRLVSGEWRRARGAANKPPAESQILEALLRKKGIKIDHAKRLVVGLKYSVAKVRSVVTNGMEARDKASEVPKVESCLIWDRRAGEVTIGQRDATLSAAKALARKQQQKHQQKANVARTITMPPPTAAAALPPPKPKPAPAQPTSTQKKKRIIIDNGDTGSPTPALPEVSKSTAAKNGAAAVKPIEESPPVPKKLKTTVSSTASSSLPSPVIKVNPITSPTTTIDDDVRELMSAASVELRHNILPGQTHVETVLRVVSPYDGPDVQRRNLLRAAHHLHDVMKQAGFLPPSGYDK